MPPLAWRTAPPSLPTLSGCALLGAAECCPIGLHASVQGCKAAAEKGCTPFKADGQELAPAACQQCTNASLPQLHDAPACLPCRWLLTLQVKPTHVFNCAGVTGRPNVDWCEDHKVRGALANGCRCWPQSPTVQRPQYWCAHAGALLTLLQGCVMPCKRGIHKPLVPSLLHFAD